MDNFKNIFAQFGTKRTTPTKTEIPDIEQLVQFQLPQDYKYFLQEYTGFEGNIGREYLGIWDLDELIELNSAYEIPAMLSRTLAIGSNLGGECIALQLTLEGSFRVILIPFTSLNETDQIVIGDSFTDFFVRLMNGDNWFGTKS